MPYGLYLINAPLEYWCRHIQGPLGAHVPVATEVSTVDEQQALAPAL